MLTVSRRDISLRGASGKRVCGTPAAPPIAPFSSRRGEGHRLQPLCVRLHASEDPPSASRRPATPATPATPAERARWLKALSPELCQTAKPAGCFPKAHGKAPAKIFGFVPAGLAGCDVFGVGKAVIRLGEAPGPSPWHRRCGVLVQQGPSVSVCSRSTTLIFNCSCVLLRCVVCFSQES
jgi:hypothetical protein